ncbi:Glycogen debranching enzyme [Streptomyces californicus]
MTTTGWRTAARRPRGPTPSYELHVRGFTRLHPDIPPELRGTYAGLAHPAAIGHLTRLGVTAVELLPVHQFAHEDHLLRRGLHNYWGYNSIGYFAPHAGYSASGTAGGQVGVRRMVRALHDAGIEVILDVVYDRTAEAGERGPTLSLRGMKTGATTGYSTTRAATPSTPAAATPSTSCSPRCCGSSPTRCATGSPRWASTASASTWRRRWPARCTTWTCSPRSSR